MEQARLVGRQEVLLSFAMQPSQRVLTQEDEAFMVKAVVRRDREKDGSLKANANKTSKDFDLQDFKRRRSAGESLESIADTYETSEPTLRNWRIRRGIMHL
jgi:hypothetical protein